MDSGDLNRALQYYKEAVKLKPAFPEAYLNLGNIYKALAMPQEAIVCYQRAVQTRPNYPVALGNLASTYYERGQLDLAIHHYKQAIAYDQRFVEAYNNLGNALKDVGRVDEAIQCYNVGFSGNLSSIFSFKVIDLLNLPFFIDGEAMSHIATQPSASTYQLREYIYGMIFWNSRNMVGAAASYYKATLAVTTGLSAPFNNLAVIYKQQGNHMEAISCYNEVLRIDPLAADGLVNRGNTYKEI
ncbi:hypothetical protein Gorai_019617, partial [Gossypium raimondii]|nr:hypothetical protein [Gossypium raimondii]